MRSFGRGRPLNAPAAFIYPCQPIVAKEPPPGPGWAHVRRKPCVERKAALRKLLRHGRSIQYVEHAEGHGDRLFEAICKLGLEGIVSKKFDAPYRSGRSNTWIKVKNPKAPAATRAVDGTF